MCNVFKSIKSLTNSSQYKHYGCVYGSGRRRTAIHKISMPASQAHQAFHPCGVGKLVPVLSGRIAAMARYIGRLPRVILKDSYEFHHLQSKVDQRRELYPLQFYEHYFTLKSPTMVSVFKIEKYSINDSQFHLKMIAIVSEDEFTYRCDMWELLKWAAVQYATVFIVVNFLINSFLNFLFRNRLLDAVPCCKLN
uniref:Transmembrane protein 231 n=1 Tax=Angiostrongylus cantonensis TaxID=6313 RepID=A0A0K0DG90_ANGCA